MSSDAGPVPDISVFVRHAVLYGDELVVETARDVWTGYVDSLRPQPLDITWLPEAERDRIIDERIAQWAALFHTEAVRLKKDLDRLPAEIALARRQAGKKDVARNGARRPTTPQLREQVLDLQGRGLNLAAIGVTLNISDRRARQIVRDAGNSQNRARNPAAGAKKRANTAVT